VNVGGDYEIGRSVCRCVHHSVCTWWLIIAMTSLHQQRKQQRRLLLFPLRKAVLSSPFPPCCIV